MSNLQSTIIYFMELTTLRTKARYYVSPQLTSTDYPDSEVDSNINIWYRVVMSWAIKEQGDWELNGDILTQDLQVGVTNYSIPSTLISIYKAEIMYETGGGYVAAEVIDVQRNQGSVEGNTSGRTIDDTSRPTIEVFGDILQLKPAPTEAVVNGFMIWAQLDFVDIDASTNNVPNLLNAVQSVLSYGAAYDYCLAHEMWSKAAEIKRIIFGDPRVSNDNGFKGIVESLYPMRNNNRRDRVSTRNRSYR